MSGILIEIIEDTPELVVINKPSSIPCHPCGKFRFNSIVFIMGKEFGYANLRSGCPFLGIGEGWRVGSVVRVLDWRSKG